MTAKQAVLDVLKKAGKPLTAGEVEQISGLTRKEVDDAFKTLKKENAITSPIRCKWEPTK